QQDVALGIARLVFGARLGCRRSADFARTQHVQTYSCGHRPEPPTEIGHRRRIRAAKPEPRLLDGILRLLHRSQDAVGHVAQMQAVCLELLRQPLDVHVGLLAHSHPNGRTTITTTMNVTSANASHIALAARRAARSELGFRAMAWLMARRAYPTAMPATIVAPNATRNQFAWCQAPAAK